MWCGEWNGRVARKICSGANRPAIEWILVVSIASSSLISGIRLAIIDLPVPGGPSIRTL